MKNIVVVDIDSSLYCFLSAFRREAAEKGAKVPHPVYIKEWNGIEPYFVDFDDFAHCVQRSYSIENADRNIPYKGAVAAINRLVDLGYEVRYYTDRPKSSEEATRHWLEMYEFPCVDNLYVCVDKRDDLYRLKDRIATIIDDRPRTLVWARYELGLSDVFSLKHSYNRNLTDIPGVHIANDWNSLMTIFEKEMGNFTSESGTHRDTRSRKDQRRTSIASRVRQCFKNCVSLYRGRKGVLD